MDKKLYSKISSNNLFLLCCITLLLQACSDKEYTISEKYIESKTNVMVIDTFSVSVSTVLIDSMPTSGDSIALLGSCYDNILGKIVSNSYFQIGLPEYFDVAEHDIYDSLSLILTYSGYSYGDTLQNFGFTIHQLISEPETGEDGYFYNTSSLPYYSNSLGSCTLKPKPNGVDSFEAKLNDELGQDIFNRILSGNDAINSESAFLDYFSGIALITDSALSKSIIGFHASPSKLKIRIYSHRFGELFENRYTDFPLTNVNYQFNQITHDFSGTILESLFSQRSSVPSSETNNRAFLIGGIGILPKLQFSSLQELLYFNRGIILKAELIIRPEKTSYANYDLPENLILYQTDKYNRFTIPIYDENGNVQVGYFVLDKLYNESTYYAFDITSYIKSQLADGSYDSDNGLLITTLSAVYTNTITRLIILECENPAPKLKVYYATY